MAESVNKAELIDRLAARLEITKKAAGEAIEAIADEITKSGAKGDKVAISGCGVLEKADRLIEDRIAALDWRQMQELVAGILRGMGYKTTVSADGPDRGVDIFASPDGLGLQEPRIFVEVKHRGGAMGAGAPLPLRAMRGSKTNVSDSLSIRP